MDTAALKMKAGEFIRKYRYVMIILVAGLILMLLPSHKEQSNAPQTQTEVTQESEPDITEQLTKILSQIAGAGKVQVMLTVSTGQTTVYQYDEDVTNGENGSIHRDTVIVTDSGRGQSGLIERVDPPKYQGAIVVCDGADSAVVRLSIIEAVSKVTGLSTDRISVLKMK